MHQSFVLARMPIEALRPSYRGTVPEPVPMR